jgi:hypothetical protein
MACYDLKAIFHGEIVMLAFFGNICLTKMAAVSKPVEIFQKGSFPAWIYT